MVSAKNQKEVRRSTSCPDLRNQRPRRLLQAIRTSSVTTAAPAQVGTSNFRVRPKRSSSTRAKKVLADSTKAAAKMQKKEADAKAQAKTAEKGN